ncbi:MAG: hypothetical protein BGO31_09200 [Bacteroidetes bacterium 43-16]|nr:MAG: hypothetical protein BGO31_09200 [Bacteroidetes bacterium 43-16]
MRYYQGLMKTTARVVFITLFLELVVPATQSFALTGGPSQPEVQSFEPVATTDMVDLFSGDFVYNIPLLDIEGYPINISYHSGVGIEDEASWVGLGWNINPGVINRSVRGIPDDFSGEKIEKYLKIKPENELSLDAGFAAELFGLKMINAGIGNTLTFNNYRGMGVGFNASLNFTFKYMQTGLGISANSFDGADVNANVSLSYATSISDETSLGGSVWGGTGFNTRAGMKAISFGTQSNINSKWPDQKDKKGKIYKAGRFNSSPISFSSYVPIGLQNYVPSVGNASKAIALTFSAGIGTEIGGAFPHFKVAASGSRLEYDPYGGRASYGYLNLDQADENGLMDFSREKDGVYNRTLPNLPLSSMTYDIFSISGQGTGGMFRPFRNDFGSVYDPRTESNSSRTDLHVEAGIGTGFGGLFELGVNTTFATTEMKSGPWNKKPFNAQRPRSSYEAAYFKQAGEMTASRNKQNNSTKTKGAVRVNGAFRAYDKNRNDLGNMSNYVGTFADRTSRANLLTYFTNREAATVDKLAMHRYIQDYHKSNTFLNNTPASISRLSEDGGLDRRKPHHIGEFTQVLPDGRRYVYGIPAMNNLQKEASFSIDSKEEGNPSYSTGLTAYSDQQNSKNNASGRDKFFQMSITPAYAHSYLLTAVLSNDYVDITGDGPTEDDLGNYTKINYRRTSKDYRWRSPFLPDGTKSAQYNPGYYSDKGDDKASYIAGSKELWYIHSIESKNYIAEFYISERSDAKGVTEEALISLNDVAALSSLGTKTDQSLRQKSASGEERTYKLDYIKLFHKNDRFVNGNNAIPVKTVNFKYETNTNAQLCKGVPNVTTQGTGKLTLKSISFQNGNSDISLMNPYEFEYSAHNPDYSFISKDRWGNYQQPDPGIAAFEFPYVRQNKSAADLNATAWQLTKIKMPSKGVINISYESDDYSYVLDKPSMEMFQVAGVGNSKNYIPDHELYLDQNNIRNYVYFKRDPAREFKGRSLKENYLPDDDLLYFNFFLDISGKNRFEPVKGYAKVEEIGLCTNDTLYGYFKLKPEPAGKNTVKTVHPVSLSGFNIGRMYLPHVIYPGSTDEGDINIAETVRGMQGAMNELFSIAQNPYMRFIDRGLSKRFDRNRSWIRVNTPGMTKLGGGSRVKQLTFSDNWSQMSPNGTDAAVGKVYHYTTTDPVTGQQISSGVANYEPLIGGDENPNRRPVSYTGDGGRLLPPVQMYQEEPLGESFFPSGSVGYSKVTVSSIHKDEGKSSKNLDEYAFYTTRDFPYYVDKTSINVDDEFRKNGFQNRSERLAVSQGFSVVLNDMHGKAKSIANYVMKGREKELISSVTYKYKIDHTGKLDNNVSIVGRTNSAFQGKFKMESGTIGEEIDLSLDNRERINHTLQVPVNFNLNVLNFGVVPIPVPTLFVPVKTEESIFRTATATKIVQQYGILIATEVNDHGAITVNENVVFDGETGNVIVSKTSNEFKDPITNINYPAMWAYPNMGGAYANIGYETDADSLHVNSFGNAYILGVKGQSLFTEGDELLINANGQTHIVWVEKIEPCVNWGNCSDTSSPAAAVPPSIIGGIIPGMFGNFDYDPTVVTQAPGVHTGEINTTGGSCCVLKVVPRMRFPQGNTLWLPKCTTLKNITIKIIRSGRKNQLGDHFMNMAVAGSFLPADYNQFFNGSFNNKVLTAATSKFTNSRREDNFDQLPWGNARGFNQFVRGLTGYYNVAESYNYKTGRNYANAHSRADGLLQNFMQVWYNPNDYVSSSCTDYALKYNQLWNSANSFNWISMMAVKKYNPMGVPVEEQDASGMRSTALFGYGQTLPIAVAQNANFWQIRYFSFEDQDRIMNGTANDLGRFFESAALPYLNPTAVSTQYGRTFFKPAADAYGEGTMVVNEGHTGQRSLKLTQASGLSLGRPAHFGIGERFYISLWVKGFVAASNNMGLRYVTSTGLTTQNPFVPVGKPIDGWQKVEAYFDMPSVEQIALYIPVNGLMDDVRICPAKSNMKSFAYNPLNFRLYASLDENNYATFFEYDAEGKLIRTKKETEKGILTVNESRMSVSK